MAFKARSPPPQASVPGPPASHPVHLGQRAGHEAGWISGNPYSTQLSTPELSLTPTSPPKLRAGQRAGREPALPPVSWGVTLGFAPRALLAWLPRASGRGPQLPTHAGSSGDSATPRLRATQLAPHRQQQRVTLRLSLPCELEVKRRTLRPRCALPKGKASCRESALWNSMGFTPTVR